MKIKIFKIDEMDEWLTELPLLEVWFPAPVLGCSQLPATADTGR